MTNQTAATTRILAKDEFVSNDTWATGLNNNDLIVGPTGSGKTRYYVKPNLLQMNESVIVTDTKGLLVKEVGPVLAAHGYDVVHLDFTNPASGIGYNPLDFVGFDATTGRYCEQDIMSIAEALVPIETRDDLFWENAAKMFVACLIGYVFECLPEEERTLEYVVELVGEVGTGVTEELMRELCVIDPSSFAARKWRQAISCKKAEKMFSSIVGIVSEKLNPLSFDDMSKMFSKRKRIDLRAIGDKKTAVFLTVSDVDRTLDRIVALFYMQALQQLVRHADDDCGGRLPVPVRLYLDDFATNCRIEDFDKTISVIRSRDIAVSIVLQSITQLDTLYGHASSMTIVNGCDHLVYLGGQDIETARFVGTKANKTVDTILNQPVGNIWLFERGRRGKTVKRYELKEHALYGELPEAQRRQPEMPEATGEQHGAEPECEGGRS